MNVFKNLPGKGLALIGLLVATVTTHAHPGHDILEHGPRHAFTSVDHLLVIAICGMLLAGFGFIAQKKHVRRALVGGGSLAVVAAAVLWMVG